MRAFCKFTTLCGLLLLIGAGAFAQGTTGSLTGTVEHDGALLPGVTVTASSPALQGTRTAVTGDYGGYIFPSLPPGTYTITFEMSGMTTVTEKAQLSLAQTTRVSADLKLTTVAAAITVTASALAVMETPQIARTFTRQELDKLPITRNIASVVALAPGVNSGIAGASISGAASSENVYLINGVQVNENLRGQPHNLFIEDAIQEMTVLTGGISAEYGRFTGGVVSTITKSGGNEFTGSFRDSLTNSHWRKKTPWPTEADHLDDIGEVYEATLGGYVMKDRLWFFTAGRQVETTSQSFTSITNLPFASGTDETRLEGKLTAQITPKYSLVGSYIDVETIQKNNAFGTIMDFRSLDVERSLPNTLGAIVFSGVLTTNWFIEANYGKKEYAFVGSGADSRDRIEGTLMIDTAGRRYWSPTFCGICTDEGRNNDAYMLKSTYYLSSKALGNHSIVAGYENYAEERIVNNHQSGSDFRVTTPTVIVNGVPTPRFDSSTRIAWNPIFKFSEGSDLQTNGLFVNDRWDLNDKWSFNVGVRFDKNDGKDADGNVVANDSELSPRLGAQFDVFGDGRHRINANWGRYVAKIADGNVGGAAASSGNPSTVIWRYSGPPVNPSSVPNAQLLPTNQALALLWAWFDSVGGTTNSAQLVSSSITGFADRIEDPIQSPSTNEFTIGYGLTFGRSGHVRTDLVHRDWSNFYAARLNSISQQTADPLFGNKTDYRVTVNDDQFTERQYDAIQMQAGWRPNRFNLGASYTYSELEGNDDTESGASATVRSTPGQLFYPEYLDYAQRRPIGRLSEDTRHRARVWAGYDIPGIPVGELNVSVLQQYESGSPYSAAGSIDASSRAVGNTFPGAPANPGYNLNLLGDSHTYFFSERGAFETDVFHRTDLALNYSLPIRQVNFFFQGQVLNLFDNDAVLSPNSTVYSRRSAPSSTIRNSLLPFNPRTTTPIECPQGAAPEVCTSMGGHWQKAPEFGKATGVSSYQTPFEYRLSAGIRF